MEKVVEEKEVGGFKSICPGENWTKKQNEVEGPHCCELPWTTEQFQ